MLRPWLAFVLAVAACGGGSSDPDARPPGPCNDISVETTPGAGMHVAVGTPITWPTNPPSGGSHFPAWARWDATYDPGIERGFYVHNTEHGGVVLLFNCPTGCPAVVAGLEALQDALPQDPSCTPPIRARTIITADPALPAGVQVGASAWGALYTATCLDEPSLRAFVDGHYAAGPEDTCAQGSVP